MVYEELLARPGEEIEYDEELNVVPRKDKEGGTGENGLVRLEHWMPERTHEIGRGSDWVSIWRHKQ